MTNDDWMGTQYDIFTVHEPVVAWKIMVVFLADLHKSVYMLWHICSNNKRLFCQPTKPSSWFDMIYPLYKAQQGIQKVH